MITTLKSRLPTLSDWLASSHTGEPHRHSSVAAAGDTLVWEPSATLDQRRSCSTPSNTTWTEVVVRSRRRAPGGVSSGAPSSVGIPLTNKYSVLSRGEHPARQLELVDATTTSAVVPLLMEHHSRPSTRGCWPPSGWTSTVGPLTFVLGSAKAAPPGRCEVALPAPFTARPAAPPSQQHRHRDHRTEDRTGNISCHR